MTKSEIHNGDDAEFQLAEVAFRRLLDGILSGDLPPGAHVSEATLMARYDLTRAPTRHALARLGHEGWLRPQPRRGYLITPITLRSVRELFDLRKQLEPEAARRAAGRIDSKAMGLLNDATSQPYDPSDPKMKSAFFGANAQLHTEIAIAAGNLRIAHLIRGLHDESERILRVGMRFANWSANWQHGHDELLEALAAGRGQMSFDIALRQLEFSERIVMDAVTAALDQTELLAQGEE